MRSLESKPENSGYTLSFIKRAISRQIRARGGLTPVAAMQRWLNNGQPGPASNRDFQRTKRCLYGVENSLGKMLSYRTFIASPQQRLQAILSVGEERPTCMSFFAEGWLGSRPGAILQAFHRLVYTLSNETLNRIEYPRVRKPPIWAIISANNRKEKLANNHNTFFVERLSEDKARRGLISKNGSVSTWCQPKISHPTGDFSHWKLVFPMHLGVVGFPRALKCL